MLAVALALALSAMPPRLDAAQEARVVEALLQSTSFKVRMQAASTLGHSGSPGAVAPLSRALSDPEPAVRAAAAVALGKLGEPSGIAPLTLAASDADDFVAEHVRKALLALARPEDLPALWAAAQQAAVPGRRAVAAAIAGIHTDAARDVLLQLSADPDPGVRELARAAIARLTPALRAQLVIRALDHHEGRVRVQAALLAARDHLTDAIPALAAVAGREDELDDVRRMAKRALWELRDAIDPAAQLLALKTAPEPEKRIEACALLGVRGADGAVPALSQALQSDDSHLRWAAAAALADLGTQDAAEVIRAAAARETQLGVRVRLEKLAREAGSVPAWHSLALGY